MRIAIVNPNTTRSMTDAVIRSAAKSARPGTELIAVTPARGVPSIESHVDEAWGALSVLREVERCEALEKPPDAYVIACFGDTGVPAAREAARGPVVGMTESALLTATLLAHRFVIITMPARTQAQSDAVVRSLGLGHRCEVRAVDQPVAEVENGSSPFAAGLHIGRPAGLGRKRRGYRARLRRAGRPRRTAPECA